jgi:hypothetical protein
MSAATIGTARGSAEPFAERIIAAGPKSGAEALKELRMAFPDSPLSLRVAALAVAARQLDDSGAASFPG